MGTGRQGEVIRILPGNVGYADLERLSDAMVDSMFALFEDTDAIIFDMRGYPRDNPWAVVPHLTDRDHVVAALFRMPLVTEPRGTARSEAGGHVYEFTQQLYDLPRQPTYRGRTVMLIDERTLSQAEHLGLHLEAANGTIFVGTPTSGANGGTTRFVLPGNIQVTFTGQDVRHADGRQLQRVGLQPNVFVAPTITGIRAGRDEVLERALEYLESSN
jgi:hypothetical protein